jgi:hypothetical protein
LRSYELMRPEATSRNTMRHPQHIARKSRGS